MKTLGINPADARAGVVGYSANVVLCPVTGKQTNCYYKTPSGRRVLAYDQAAADKQDDAKDGRPE